MQNSSILKWHLFIDLPKKDYLVTIITLIVYQETA